MASIGTCDSVTDRGWARLPTTTTRSSSSTAIATSRVVVAPAVTSTALRTTVENPDSVNVTSCVPGSSAPIVNRPAASVTTVATRVRSVWTVGTAPAPSGLRASTVTPRRTKPVVWVTVPESVPFRAGVSTVARKGVILHGRSTTTCRGCRGRHRRQEPAWTSVRGAGVKAVSPAKRGRSVATRLDAGEHTRTLSV